MIHIVCVPIADERQRFRSPNTLPFYGEFASDGNNLNHMCFFSYRYVIGIQRLPANSVKALVDEMVPGLEVATIPLCCRRLPTM